MESDAIVLEPIPEPLPPRYAPQQLRLHHLFVLTAVMSFLLAVSAPQWNVRYEGFEMPPAVRTATLVTGVIYTVIASVAITATLFGIYWQRQGFVVFHQPGHWLMVEIAAATLVGLIPQLVVYAVGAGYGGETDFTNAPEMWPLVIAALMGTMGLVIVGLTIAFNVYIAHQKCSQSHWSHVFYFKAAAAIIPVIAPLLVLGFLARAVYIDGRADRRRDALHRCGVVVQFAVIAVTLLITVFIFAALIYQIVQQF